MNPRHSWTEADFQLLRDHYRGMGVSWCATKLGVSNQRCYEVARGLGLPAAAGQGRRSHPKRQLPLVVEHEITPAFGGFSWFARKGSWMVRGWCRLRETAEKNIQRANALVTVGDITPGTVAPT